MRIHAEVVRGRQLPESVVVEASDVAAASELLSSQGYSVLTARRLPGVTGWVSSSRRKTDRSPGVGVFIEQLRDLLMAGLSVIEALETLHRSNPGRSQVIAGLMARLKSGEPLSRALAQEPQFPSLLVALVQTAEMTSDLPEALERYLAHRRRVDQVRDAVSAVAIYPVLLLIVGTGVLLFLMLYVIPRFAKVFEGIGGDLPWTAAAMMAWSRWLDVHMLGLAIVVAILSAAPVALWQIGALRRRALEWFMGLNWVHRYLTTYLLARWYRATGMLAAGGIPLPEALRLANDLLPGPLGQRGVGVIKALREGVAPALAYARAGMATPVAEQLMRAGEQTGDFGGVLGRIAAFHEAEVTRSLERLMRALEPTVMVFIGLAVGVIVVLMYMPIFELTSALQ